MIDSDSGHLVEETNDYWLFGFAPVVPLSTQVEAKGRAFLIVSFDEHELSRNSDFEYVGEARESTIDD